MFHRLMGRVFDKSIKVSHNSFSTEFKVRRIKPGHFQRSISGGKNRRVTRLRSAYITEPLYRSFGALACSVHLSQLDQLVFMYTLIFLNL